MRKNFIEKLYWVFWYAVTITTGILAGFMVSHSIVLGRFYNWFVDSGNMDLLRQTYTVFRKESSPHVLYYVPIYLGLVLGIVWIVLAFILKKDRILSLISGLSTFWVGAVFSASGMGKAEEAVMTATASDSLAQYYSAINIPLHASFAVIYTVCLLLLLLIGTRRKSGVAG